MSSLDNPITIKLDQTTLTQEQWRLIKLSTNAANVVYNVDLPLFMVPDGYQRVETGYVLDNQPNFDFMGGDGIQVTDKAQSGVAFDVDDSGFLKATGWLADDTLGGAGLCRTAYFQPSRTFLHSCPESAANDPEHRAAA